MIPYHKFSFPISAWVISIFHLKIFFKSRKNENVLYISLRDNISRKQFWEFPLQPMG